MAQEDWTESKATTCRAAHLSAYNALASVLPGGLPLLNWDEVRPGPTTESITAIAEIAAGKGVAVDYPGSAAVEHVVGLAIAKAHEES